MQIYYWHRSLKKKIIVERIVKKENIYYKFSRRNVFWKYFRSFVKKKKYTVTLVTIYLFHFLSHYSNTGEYNTRIVPDVESNNIKLNRYTCYKKTLRIQ